jgi:hypothetical protein
MNAMNETSPETQDCGKGSKKLTRLRHINPERAARAARTAEIKNIHVRTGSFVQASKYFDDLVERVNAGIEGNCLVIYGASGAGKSHILKQFRQMKELRSFETDEGRQLPMLMIEAPAPCTLSTLGRQILSGLDYEVETRLSETEIWNRVSAQLIAQGVGILVIDEMHNVLAGRNILERRKIAMTLKAHLVSEEWPLQVVLSGLPAASNFIKRYSELRRRTFFLELNKLHPTTDSKLLDIFLKGLEKELRFPQPSRLSESDMPERLMLATLGYVGRIAYLVQEAAIVATVNNSKSIEPGHFGYVFERHWNFGPKRNPFLIPNVKDFAPIKEKEFDEREAQLTKLIGTSETGEITEW